MANAEAVILQYLTIGGSRIPILGASVTLDYVSIGWIYPRDPILHILVFLIPFFVLGKCTTFCLDVLDTAIIKYKWPGVLVIKSS